MRKRELIALRSLSSWGLVIVCVALPRGVMGLSAVCDCGISRSYSLTFSEYMHDKNKEFCSFLVAIN